MTDKQHEERIEKKANQLNRIILKFKDNSHSYKMNQLKDFISSIIKDCQPEVSREWIYYFCAYINAAHKSPADDKARVEHAIKKLKEIGVEVSK